MFRGGAGDRHEEAGEQVSARGRRAPRKNSTQRSPAASRRTFFSPGRPHSGESGVSILLTAGTLLAQVVQEGQMPEKKTEKRGEYRVFLDRRAR